MDAFLKVSALYQTPLLRLAVKNDMINKIYNKIYNLYLFFYGFSRRFSRNGRDALTYGFRQNQSAARIGRAKQK